MLRRRLLSFKYAFKGIAYLFVSQPHARFHAVAAIAVVLLGLWLQIDRTDWALLTLSIGGVLMAEAFNTALEELTDLVSPEYHLLAGRTKDVAAGAVLLFAMAALVVGGLIFIPKLLQWWMSTGTY